MLLRIDDTDPSRDLAGGKESMVDQLARLGVAWDEGPTRQSKRPARHRAPGLEAGVHARPQGWGAGARTGTGSAQTRAPGSGIVAGEGGGYESPPLGGGCCEDESAMRLYSTLSRRLEELPAPPGPIRMYVCGSTVYARVHVGNSRPFVLAMWLRRWLRSRGYEVTLVHNITDVDDKVYEEAARLEIHSRDLAEMATGWFFRDTDDLGLGRPDVEPRASETIPEIIAFIEALIAGGKAYESEGSVYFRVAGYPDYGQLSGAQLDDMVAQEPNPAKEDERDFALWKAQKPHEDAAWDSPWGPGRPGWHIECSAMAEKHLGPEFEIHGGGLDLRFPHHENELAQSRSRGFPFAHIWLHNGMLELGAEKMSKSLGNVVTLRNVLDVWGKDVLLLFHLSGHWRKPVDFTDEALESSRTQLAGFREVLALPERDAADDWARIEVALDDDFNTPAALAVLHDWASRGARGLLARGLDLFGIDTEFAVPEEVEVLRRAREEARAAKDWSAADAARDEIEQAGWAVTDHLGGTAIWPRP
jgi:cysteinyl-tRNA synthetase